jgi:hypothetical protein
MGVKRTLATSPTSSPKYVPDSDPPISAEGLQSDDDHDFGPPSSSSAFIGGQAEYYARYGGEPGVEIDWDDISFLKNTNVEINEEGVGRREQVRISYLWSPVAESVYCMKGVQATPLAYTSTDDNCHDRGAQGSPAATPTPSRPLKRTMKNTGVEEKKGDIENSKDAPSFPTTSNSNVPAKRRRILRLTLAIELLKE